MLLFVEVACPMVSQVYDFRVDSNMTIGKFMQKIVEDIASINKDITIFACSKEVVLFSSIGALPKQKTLAEVHVHSGDRLLLL